MAYEYEIFFSYKRGEKTDPWHKALKDRIEYWLAQELYIPKANVFFDSQDIEAGDMWREHIENDLKKSKCLVAILSPAYFLSKHCLAEWKSFIKRGKECEVSVKSLIVPASFHDGDSFPAEAKAIQGMDFTNYASTFPIFWTTARADEFEQNEIKPFVKSIASAVRNAPEFSDNFPVIDPDDIEIEQTVHIGRPSDSM